MPEPTPPTRRRWFRFGLRSLLVFTALVGLLMGWIVKERRQSAREMEIANELDANLNISVPYVSHDTPETGWWARGCEYIFGPRVFGICTASWDDLTPVEDLDHLRSLRVDRAKFTSLEPLADHSRLESLSLYAAPIVDLAPLKRCQRLERLNLEKTKVTDLSPISGLTALEELNVSDTQVPDLTPLAGLKNLQMLEIFGIPVTREQVNSLQKSLPNCEILHD